MNEFMVIEVMNEAMIRTLRDRNENCDVYLKIKEKLKDEAFFFKISKEKSYELLKIIGVKEEKLEDVYKKLIDINIYRNLLKEGKIKEDDETLLIKYESMEYNDIFKKKNT